MCWKSVCLVSCVLAASFAHPTLAAVPGNDHCQNAKSVGNVTDLPFDTTSATFDGPGHVMTSPNIWYCYTATCNGCVTVSLLGSSFNTELAVYDGCGCDPALADLIESNDNFSSQQSKLTFPAKAGKQYLIEVGGESSSDTGEGVISISCNDLTDGPSNDDCSNARYVGNVKDLPYDTTCATFDGPGHCMVTPNLWYCYSAPVTGDVTVSLERLDLSVDTMLAVYDGSDCYPALDALIECNDDFGDSFDSQITFKAIAGNEYLIEVGSRIDEEAGPGHLTISSGGPVPPWSNDDCHNAWPIGEVAYLPFDTTDATFDGQGHCMYSPNVWYCYTAACTGQATISLCGSGFDTMLAVYDGCQCSPGQGDMIACNDDDCDLQSEATIDVVAGRRYLIEVGGYGSDTGQGVLSVSVSCDSPVRPDLGDAPDSTNNYGATMTAYSAPATVQANFPTVFNDGSSAGPYGPAHLNAPTGAFLGKKVTSEREADTGSDDDGANNIAPQTDLSDNDDGDDGVVVPLRLPHCEWATFDYQVTVVDPKIDLWVNVWIDFNRDGDWDDTIACDAGQAPEWAVQNQYLFGLPVGSSQVTTPALLSWHPKSGPAGVWMRITISEQPWKGGSNPGEQGNGGSGPATKYAIGETEDYYFIPDKTPGADCPLCEDVNGDGVIDMEDVAALTVLWIENCF
ncbi:MAG: GEVED domain-containing protein [Planctomycetota bacterium]|jgi:hypothetical protein